MAVFGPLCSRCAQNPGKASRFCAESSPDRRGLDRGRQGRPGWPPVHLDPSDRMHDQPHGGTPASRLWNRPVTAPGPQPEKLATNSVSASGCWPAGAPTADSKPASTGGGSSRAPTHRFSSTWITARTPWAKPERAPPTCWSPASRAHAANKTRIGRNRRVNDWSETNGEWS